MQHAPRGCYPKSVRTVPLRGDAGQKVVKISRCPIRAQGRRADGCGDGDDRGDGGGDGRGDDGARGAIHGDDGDDYEESTGEVREANTVQKVGILRRLGTYVQTRSWRAQERFP